MLAAILAFFNLIPGLSTVVSSVVTAIFNAKVSIAQAKLGADRDVAVALVTATEAEAHERTASLSAIGASRLLSLIVVGFAVPLIAYEWKVVVWDQMLGWGSTPELKGLVANWANTVIAFLFGTTTTMALAQMWFTRKTS